MTQKSVEASKPVSQEIDYIRLIRIIASRWYWIAACLVVSILWAYLYLRFTPPTYQTSALLKFDDKKTEISELININSYYDRKDKIQSEIYVIQSRTLLLKAIQRLNYQITFLRKGRVLEYETYPQKPFEVIPVSIDSSTIFSYRFHIKQLNPIRFNFTYHELGQEIVREYNYGQEIRIGKNKFQIKKANVSPQDKGEFIFYFNTNYSFLGRVSGGLKVREVGKGINIMLLSFTDNNPVFAADILNAITNEYRLFDKDQKGLAAAQTIEFIDDQLVRLSEQVKTSEKQLEEFKRGKSILNIDDSKNIAYQTLKDLEVQKNLIRIQGIAIDLLEEQVKANKDVLSLSFATEGEDELIKERVSQLNELLSERIKRQSLYAANSAPLIEINKQIEEARKGVIMNIQAARNRNTRTIKFLDSQLELAREGLKQIPGAERDLINLQRDFEINQRVYSYLLEKRLEASVAKSAIMPTSNVIDPAVPNHSISSPNSRSVYTTALTVGFLVGIGLIFAARLLNQRIHNKETVESLTNIPIIGVIRSFPGHIDKNSRQILTISNPKSVFSESVRSVRTNLSFLASELKSKIVCVTSEVSGEGKSFVVINLASTLALINKKVVVIDGDLRKSKLHHTFNLKNDIGLTSFLSNQSTLDKIIHRTQVENLDFIPAGPMPPNPSELLYSEQMRMLISQLKERYDFILLDTAPIGLVSDAIPLIRNGDVNIFVLRAGVSTYNAAAIPDRVSKEFGLKNTVIVLNDFKNDTLHTRVYSSHHRAGHYGSGQYYYTDYSYGSKHHGYYGDNVRQSIFKRVENFVKSFLRRN